MVLVLFEPFVGRAVLLHFLVLFESLIRRAVFFQRAVPVVAVFAFPAVEVI